MPNNESKTALVRNLKKFMKQSTQEEFATQIGISQCYLSAILNGKRVPGIKMLEQIADKLGVSISALLASPEEKRALEKRIARNNPQSA